MEALLNRLDAEDRELHWRRGEMAWLSEKSRRGAGSLFLALGRLRSRVRSWSGDSEAGGAE